MNEVKYSRKDCVTAVRDYYHFLAAMYLKEDEILIREPPLGGWASMRAENMDLLGKDEEVGVLLRQLPLLIHCSPIMPHCAPQTFFADWTTNMFHLGIGLTTLEFLKSRTEASCPKIPAHCIGLTDGSPDGYGATFILDTKFGLVHWLKCPEHLRNAVVRPQVSHDHLYGPAAATEVPWLFPSGTWTVVDFFDMLKDLFRSMLFVPGNQNQVYDIGDTREEEQDKIHVIMRTFWDHGWPDLKLYAEQKGKCVELVARYVDQWCQARIERQEAMEKEAKEMEERATEMEEIVDRAMKMERATEMVNRAMEMERVTEMEMEMEQRPRKRRDKGKGRAVEERPTSQSVYAFPETDLDFDLHF